MILKMGFCSTKFEVGCAPLVQSETHFLGGRCPSFESFAAYGFLLAKITLKDPLLTMILCVLIEIQDKANLGQKNDFQRTRKSTLVPQRIMVSNGSLTDKMGKTQYRFVDLNSGINSNLILNKHPPLPPSKKD